MNRLPAFRRLAALVATGAILVPLALMATPAAAVETGSVSGTVTAADTGLPLSGVNVVLYDSDRVVTGFAVTAEDGSYTASDVPAGEHVVYFDTQSNISAPRDYVSQWYPDVQFKSSATPVTVVAGESLVIDRVLPVGGKIQGTVKNPSNTVISSTVTVWAWDAVASEWVIQTRLSSGNEGYTARGLREGLYSVGFGSSYASTGLASEFYDNATALGGSTNVSVVGTQTTSGINAILGSRTIPTTRIAGSNRYDTAARIAQRFPDTDTVFLASGEDFPDALSAAPAAATLNSPLLLTTAAFLPTETANALDDLSPSKVIIMGSTGSISGAVETSVRGILPGVEIQRIAGSNRYETSRALVRYLLDAGAYDSIHADTYIATGFSYPDALSVAAIAGSTRAPVILVPGISSTLDPETAALIEELGNEGVRLIGGSSSISNGIRDQALTIPGVEYVHREHGPNRYITSLYINWYFSSPVDRAYIASGENFADALAGGALAGLEGVPLFLSHPSCMFLEVKGTLFDRNTQDAVLLGGTSSLSPAISSLTSC